METIRALVRPAVTFGLVAAFIAAAFLGDDPAKLLAGPMGLAVGWYFRERSS
ncbi:hypothetical protein LCGC14_2266020 [marine sediment metagenome]|uniref:Uncharacterized protein n=1 Tax=marine sediment metagenome TaxID=412755 RepID=A0A0F9FTD9_9ZZZZ